MLHDSPSKTARNIQVYRVRGAIIQQRILAAFHRINRPGVVALGTQSGPGWFIVLECSSLADEIRAARVVMTIDPMASRTIECEVEPDEKELL